MLIIKIWGQYKKSIKNNVKIMPIPTPRDDHYWYIGEHPSRFYVCTYIHTLYFVLSTWCLLSPMFDSVCLVSFIVLLRPTPRYPQPSS